MVDRDSSTIKIINFKNFQEYYDVVVILIEFVELILVLFKNFFIKGSFYYKLDYFFYLYFYLKKNGFYVNLKCVLMQYLKAHRAQKKSLDKANDDKLLLDQSSNVYEKIPLDKILNTHQHNLVV